MNHENSQKVCDLLNRALKSDPATIKSLISNRLPCSKEIESDPHIVVGSDRSLSSLGLINGILSLLNVESIAVICEIDQNGNLTNNIIEFIPTGLICNCNKCESDYTTG